MCVSSTFGGWHRHGDSCGFYQSYVPGGNVAAWVVTIFCVVGVTNAINLIDGLDGLAGGISFIAFIFFAIHASLAEQHTLMLLNLALAGAILGFLRFNWYPSVLFMGDAGSLCLGFSLAFMALALTQGESAGMIPVNALLILAIPITDTIIVMFKRIFRGQSPFKPDKYHLHHIFLRYGMAKDVAVRTILAISLLLGCCTLLGPVYGLSEAWLFTIYLLFFTVYLALSFCIIRFFRYSLRVRKQRRDLVAADYLLRLLFGLFDLLKIFRKSSRHSVTLPMSCSTCGSGSVNRGVVLNISQTGCMTKMAWFEKQSDEMTLSLNFPLASDSLPLEVQAELLWASNVGESCYYGFRFKEMSPEFATILSENIAQLPQQQQIEVRPVAVRS